MEKFADISKRLYDILLNHNTTSENADHEEALEVEVDDDLPLECCYCSELFFTAQIFENHKCNRADVGPIIHKCTFEDCTKLFKKSGELRKHEVRV